MRSILILAAVGVAVMVLAALLSGRRAAVMGTAAVTAGLAVSLAAVLLIDCRQCNTASLAVGGFVSAPFFIAGWLVLFVVGHGPEALPWRVLASAAAVLQLGWAARRRARRSTAAARATVCRGSTPSAASHPSGSTAG